MREVPARNQDLHQQAIVFCRYLLHAVPNGRVIKRYQTFVEASPEDLSDYDHRLISYAAQHPWIIGFLDGALALRDPQNGLRRRLYLMVSILEADPDYWDYFLPRRRSPFYILWAGFIGVRAVLRAALGLLLIRMVI